MRGRGTAARPYQPEPWAADVQGVIRSTRLPAARGQFTRLRLTDEKTTPHLEAALVGEIGSKKVVFDFAIIALARDSRVAKSGVGDDMLADFDDWCRLHAVGRTDLDLAAAIHVGNAAAEELFARNGWESGIPLSHDKRYRIWGKLLSA
jgi:hypothetical protein